MQEPGNIALVSAGLQTARPSRPPISRGSRAQRGARYQLLVQGEPDVTAQRQPDHPVPLAPRTSDPPLQHPRNPAGEVKTIRNGPPAMSRRERERQLEIHPHRPGPNPVAAGDALATVSANPAQRHALLPGRLALVARGGNTALRGQASPLRGRPCPKSVPSALCLSSGSACQNGGAAAPRDLDEFFVLEKRHRPVRGIDCDSMVRREFGDSRKLITRGRRSPVAMAWRSSAAIFS